MTFTWSLTENMAKKSMERGTAWWERWGEASVFVNLHIFPMNVIGPLSLISVYSACCCTGKYFQCLNTADLTDFTGQQLQVYCISGFHDGGNYAAVSSVICWLNLQMKIAPNSQFATQCYWDLWCYQGFCCCIWLRNKWGHEESNETFEVSTDNVLLPNRLWYTEILSQF